MPTMDMALSDEYE